MQHLESERLAALTDEPPTNEELSHLAACGACRTERDAFAALAGLAVQAAHGPVGADAPRLTEWSSLSARLRAEGLITRDAITAEYPVPAVVRSINGGSVVETAIDRDVERDAPARVAVAPRQRMWSLLPAPYLQIAAALTLIVGGMAAGRISAGAPLIPIDRNPTTISTAGMLPNPNSAFSSISDATQALTRAQIDYERAAIWLANHDVSVTPAMYRKRLAALDQLMAATREVMHEAPLDPVLQYQYQATSTARETTLRQLGEVLPVNKTIERF